MNEASKQASKLGGRGTREEAISATQVCPGEDRTQAGAGTPSPAGAGSFVGTVAGVRSAQWRLITHCGYDEAERLFGKTATLTPSSLQGHC